MPIDYKKYPKNWKTEIRPRILARAQNKCERCGIENYAKRLETGSKVVLTVAHLDHDVKNNADENLRALCQKCHISWDVLQHAQNAAKTRTSRGTFQKSYKNVGKKADVTHGGYDRLEPLPSTKKKEKDEGYYAGKKDMGARGGYDRLEPLPTLRKRGVNNARGGCSNKIGVFRVILREKPILLQEYFHEVSERKKLGKMTLEEQLKKIPYKEPRYERWYLFCPSKGNDGIIIADMQEQEHDSFLVNHADRFRVMREFDGSETLYRREEQGKSVASEKTGCAD